MAEYIFTDDGGMVVCGDYDFARRELVTLYGFVLVEIVGDELPDTFEDDQGEDDDEQ